MDVRTGFHVLAVDDTATDRLIIERFLKKSSFHVTAVDSGIKALELLGLDDADSENHHHQEIDMIITDYCMPGLTGYELLMKVKGSKNLKDIPVVIMSSEQIPSRVNMCLEGGAEEFFVKPVKQHHVEMLKPHLLKSKAKDLVLPTGPTHRVAGSDPAGHGSRYLDPNPDP